jgi:hypothetical protein
MCIFSAPKPPEPDPIPASPTRDDPESVREGERQRKKLALRRGSASTRLTGPLGDSGYGGNISRAVVLGGT